LSRNKTIFIYSGHDYLSRGYQKTNSNNNKILEAGHRYKVNSQRLAAYITRVNN
jgi:hypothetical protein